MPKTEKAPRQQWQRRQSRWWLQLQEMEEEMNTFIPSRSRMHSVECIRTHHNTLGGTICEDSWKDVICPPIIKWQGTGDGVKV